jgi:hypothetical protein
VDEGTGGSGNINPENRKNEHGLCKSYQSTECVIICVVNAELIHEVQRCVICIGPLDRVQVKHDSPGTEQCERRSTELNHNECPIR